MKLYTISLLALLKFPIVPYLKASLLLVCLVSDKKRLSYCQPLWDPHGTATIKKQKQLLFTIKMRDMDNH